MKRMWFGVLVVALFVPVGARVSFWKGVTPTQLDAAEVAAGKELFTHEFTKDDPLCGGDGVGPVFNANSCVACHFQGGIGGSGTVKENVTTYVVFNTAGGCGVPFDNRPTLAGTLHSKAISDEFKETMNLLDRALPAISDPTLEMLTANAQNGRLSGSVAFSQRNTPALFGAKLINEISDREIIALARKQQLAAGMTSSETESHPVGRVLYTRDGRVGKFGWKAQTGSLLEFVQGACANELGLSNPSQPQPTSIAQLAYKSTKYDLTLEQCQQMTTYIAALAAPRQELPNDPLERKNVHAGQAVFGAMGCATCHVPNVGSVQGIYSDLLVHRMGREFETQDIGYNQSPPSGGDDPESTPLPDEWRTPPLWGIADSAPYMHDGRAKTLEDAIRLHSGQAASSAQRFNRASGEERAQLISFLNSLRAPKAN
jgi:CxxC motif-containing protein (DUF1111 family)